jgi:hypothetical protein
MLRVSFVCFFVGCGGLLSQSTDRLDGASGDGGLDGEWDDACAGSCFARTPDDWKPVGYAPPDSCPSGWREMRIFEHPSGDPPICWCSCGTNGDAKCTTSSVLLEASTDANCANAQPAKLPHQGCAAAGFDFAPNAPIYVRGTATSTTPVGGNCSGTPNLILPPAHGDRAALCVWPSAVGTCGGGRECRAPRDPTLRECISQDGDHACPVGFPERHFAGDELSDARSCTSCECMYDPPGTCTTYVTTTATSDCTGSAFVLKADGVCRKYPNAELHVGSEKMVTVVEGAACGPKKGASEPIGSVGLWHPHTICCR